MSLIAMQGGATGTGTVTLLAPITNTNQTLTLPDATGTVLSSATTTGFPAGSVLQVVSASFSTGTSTSSTAFVATHLTASITPTAATSKILVLVFGRVDTEASNRDMRLTVFRGATNIGSGSVPMVSNINGISSRLQIPVAFHLYDSPSATSSTAYTLNIQSPAASAVSFGDGSTVQIITLMEIAA